ncbi:MAG: glycosyltransferase [Pyrinomonadaceae bacterium]
MKISVVVPVRNEEHSIQALLDGLLNQTRLPDEIVITDGGSTDKTAEIIEDYTARGFPVRLIREKAALPGRGRNVAAAQASCEWLAFTDAGIRPERDWLAGLVSRAEADDADVVYGAWEPVTDSFFTECAAISYVPPPGKRGDALIRPRFIASSLMRRGVWESVGGFPEHLRSAEDLVFMNKVAEAGFQITYAPVAMVRWSLQPTVSRTFQRFVSYARNNIRAGLWTRWQAAIFSRYALLVFSALPAFVFGPRWLILTPVLWLMMLVARGMVAIWRNRRCYPAGLGRNILRLLTLVELIAVLDAAALIGSLQWFVLDRLSTPGMPASYGAIVEAPTEPLGKTHPSIGAGSFVLPVSSLDVLEPNLPRSKYEGKISVIIPVRNEENSIRPLLNSLLNQTLMPAEIVIADGGSTDSTPEIVMEYSAKGLPVCLVREGPALPGRGRNLAAAKASCDWLAFTDGGVVPEPNWLEYLARGAAAEEEVEVVYGSYEPITGTLFKECAAIAYVPPPVEKDGATLRPRSIVSALMRRRVWQSVGGFPEHLRSAEDLLFMNRVEGEGFRTVYAPAAVVHWNVQASLGRTFSRFLAYSISNIRAGLWKQWQAAIFKRYGLLFVLALSAIVLGSWPLLLTAAVWVLMLASRAGWAIWRNRKCYPGNFRRNSLRLLVIIPILAALDAAALIGSVQWFLRDKLHPVMRMAHGA